MEDGSGFGTGKVPRKKRVAKKRASKKKRTKKTAVSEDDVNGSFCFSKGKRKTVSKKSITKKILKRK